MDKPSGETASVVAQQVTTLKVKGHGVFAGRDGRVVIRAADKEEAGKIAAGLKEVQVISSGKRLPRVILFGVPATLVTADGLKEPLGLEAPPALVRITATKGSGYDATVNVVVEVNAETLRRLEDQGRVFVGHRSCQVREDVDSGRCFHCGSLSHRKGECKQEQQLCYRCGKPGHVTAACVAAANCVNCAAAKKPAQHVRAQCPMARQAEGRARHPINYE